MKQVSFNVYVFFPLKERILPLNPMNGVLFVLSRCQVHQAWEAFLLSQLR